ncbi:unnamed protein product [Protopolystoma xenopodis]|uniref:Uncharacterized protein n=1 Tax=Protopolystoma xenopodis TaxID=117903 RepID=A0A448WBE9_9PLAT|nr:unnamed protein product [Protopolystoma xenopodis]
MSGSLFSHTPLVTGSLLNIEITAWLSAQEPSIPVLDDEHVHPHPHFPPIGSKPTTRLSSASFLPTFCLILSRPVSGLNQRDRDLIVRRSDGGSSYAADNGAVDSEGQDSREPDLRHSEG